MSRDQKDLEIDLSGDPVEAPEASVRTNVYPATDTAEVLAEGLRASIQSSEGLVVTPLAADWPSRCVVCNAEVPAPTHHFRRSWNHPIMLLWLLLGVGIGLLILFLLRTKVNLLVGMCETHRARHTRNQRIVGGLQWLGAVALFGGVLADSAGVAVPGALCLLGGLVAHLLLPDPLRIRKAKGGVAWVSAGAPFVASLPAHRPNGTAAP